MIGQKQTVAAAEASLPSQAAKREKGGNQKAAEEDRLVRPASEEC
jgi:hypothetical protein